jgi:hypothetical protein
MRRNRIVIMMLVIVTVLAMATTALAGKPDKPDKPGKPLPAPDIWTCAERVENGAVWLPGEWVGDDPLTPDVEDYYLSDTTVPVDVPLCIDMVDLVDHVDPEYDHRNVVNWTVEWEGKAVRKAPKGLMFIFEEELPGTHYAEAEALPDPEEEVFLDCVFDDETGEYTCDGSWENITLTGNGDAEHLVFLAMGHQGDKWTELTFTVTPHPPPPTP